MGRTRTKGVDMNAGPLSIVVDTNVWVDTYVPSRDTHEISKRFLSVAASQGHVLFYPSRILVDVFYQVRVYFKRWARACFGEIRGEHAHVVRDMSWDCVDNMREVATAIGADGSDEWLACKYRYLCDDLEDNYVIAAAERVQADFIVTNDRGLLKASTVAALTPEDMLHVFETRTAAQH